MTALPGYIPGFGTRAVHAGSGVSLPSFTELLRKGQNVAHESSVSFEESAYLPYYAQGENRSAFLLSSSILEDRIAALEGGSAAVAVSSGSAAMFLIFQILASSGEELIFSQSYRKSDLPFSLGDVWSFKYADTADVSSFEKLLSPSTKAIFVESISPSSGQICDLESIATVAQKFKIPLIVDNSVASPYLCNPIEYGADVVIHHAETCLGTHSGLPGGLIVDAGTFDWFCEGKYPHLAFSLSQKKERPPEEFGNFAFAMACQTLGHNFLGLALPPLHAQLILSGIETLPLRMQCQSCNASAIASFLSNHPKIANVQYAALPESPSYPLSAKYFPNGAGPVLTFTLDQKSSRSDRDEMLSRLRLIACSPKPRGTRSTVIVEEQNVAVTPQEQDITLVFFAGIEDKEDLIEDLSQALGS